MKYKRYLLGVMSLVLIGILISIKKVSSQTTNLILRQLNSNYLIMGVIGFICFLWGISNTKYKK